MATIGPFIQWSIVIENADFGANFLKIAQNEVKILFLENIFQLESCCSHGLESFYTVIEQLPFLLCYL